MNCNLQGLQLAERTQTTLKELHSFNVGIFEMRSKPERFPDAYHPGSPTYCARIHNSSEEGRKLTKCEEATDTCVRPSSVCACEKQLWTFWWQRHLSVSSVKAQGCTPAVFSMKARLASSEPCYFSEKATDWIRILSSSCHQKSKGLWKRVGSFKKSLMVYIAPSPADMMEWRNRKTGTKSLWEWKGDRGYSSLDSA